MQAEGGVRLYDRKGVGVGVGEARMMEVDVEMDAGAGGDATASHGQPSIMNKHSYDAHQPYAEQQVPVQQQKAVAEQPKVAVEPQAECVCNRSPGIVVCHKCGHEMRGRTSMICPRHPNRMALMDFVRCTRKDCQSTYLQEISL